MLLRFQKATVQGNYETGNQALSMHLRFLTIRDFKFLSTRHYRPSLPVIMASRMVDNTLIVFINV